MVDVAVEVLRGLLRYDAETGKLYWLPRSPDLFRSGRLGAAAAAKAWNTKNAGREAFTATQAPGYKQGRIFGQKHYAHRVAWALAYGEWPTSEIDHENHDGTDNRLSNMTLVSHSQNAKNMALARDNTSGRVGVYWCNKNLNWYARITCDQVIHNLGCFSSFEAACAARAAAERKYGFHRNHGAERAKAA